MARKEKIWHAISCLTCAVVLWTHLDDFGASEFGGGRLTASLIKMADFASVLFAMALLLTFFLLDLQRLSFSPPRYSVYRSTCTS
jgi:hypothetical protein